MAGISKGDLFGKLNSLAYKSLESATTFCKLRGNAYVEVAHWFNQMLQLQDSDLHRIIQHYDLNGSKIASDLTTALDTLPRGATSISGFSEHVETITERGWVFASLQFREFTIRSGHLVVAMLRERGLTGILTGMSSEWGKIKVDDLCENFASILEASPETALSSREGASATGGGAAPGEASGAMAPAGMGKEEALQAYCVDFTEQAANGEMDPILGRDEEIRQIADILMRRRQNNPILTGEAGVGKTAVVEGFAQYIVAGHVPPPLQNVRLLGLDLGLLQAGASMKGEFENRLRQVIEEVQSATKPIILFIDEAHTLIGAGGAAGQNDAANLLKPALARGKLRTIAATTWAEYKKYFEKDPALTRRFQVVKVEEPDVANATVMIRGLAKVNEAHHKVHVLDDGVRAAVELSSRYIPGRQLPDKAVSLLDTACARVAISQHSIPAEVQFSRRTIENLGTELEILEREEKIGIEVSKRREEAMEKLTAEKDRLVQLEKDWKEEKDLVDRILEIRADLTREEAAPEDTPAAEGEEAAADAAAEPAAPVDREALVKELDELTEKLSEVQGDSPLILCAVDEQAVASVVGDWTGIPVGRMVKDEIQAVMRLADTLEKRVIGQRHGLDLLARRIEISRAGMENPTRPIGVFMLAGPSGVGKTETALSLAEALYGGEQNLITINMSEFQEAHTVSTLKGAPPGYVGYGEGGILTEAVRRRPYSVVLLDEVEKAHPDVHEVFFQVFDKGMMEDGEGRLIDFKNTIILLTSNVGSDLIMNMCKDPDPDLMPDPDAIATAMRKPLLEVFPAALLGRVKVIPYYPLSDDMINMIIGLQLKKIAKRLKEGHGAEFAYSDDVVALITARCQELESGARMIEAIITNTLLPDISREILVRLMDEQEIAKVTVGVEDDSFTYQFD